MSKHSSQLIVSNDSVTTQVHNSSGGRNGFSTTPYEKKLNIWPHTFQIHAVIEEWKKQEKWYKNEEKVKIMPKKSVLIATLKKTNYSKS